MCSLDVAQPSATVRKPPREDSMAAPMVNSANGVFCDGFQHRVAWFRVAGIFMTFRPVSKGVKSRFAWQAQCFCDIVRRLAAFFRSRLSTLATSSFCVAGAALFRRVLLRVVCKSHCQGCEKWYINVYDIIYTEFDNPLEESLSKKDRGTPLRFEHLSIVAKQQLDSGQPSFMGFSNCYSL